MQLSSAIVDVYLFCDRPVDSQIWALLTRCQCVESLIPRWPLRLVGLLFCSNLCAGTYLVDITLQFVVETLSGEDSQGKNDNFILTLWVVSLEIQSIILDLLCNYALLIVGIQTIHSKVCFPDFLSLSVPIVWR